MNNPSQHLDRLITALGDSPERSMTEMVSDYQEAISLAVALRRDEDSRRLMQNCLSLFEPVPYEIDLFCKHSLATLFWNRCELEKAEEYYSAGIELAKLYGDTHSEARGSMSLGVVSWKRGKYEHALEHLEKAEAGLRERRDSTLAVCLSWLGVVCSDLQCLQRAWSYYKEALELNEELCFWGNQGFILSNMSLLCQRMDSDVLADGWVGASMNICEEAGNNHGLAETAVKETELQRVKKEARLLEERNAALRLSEERFRCLVDKMSNIGVLAVNSRGKVTFWNETCRAFYGYRSDEACGRKLSDLIIPEHLRNWFTAFVQSGMKNGEFEVNLRALDGGLKSVLISLVPLKEDETFVIQVDLTSQRHAENQRTLLEAQMRRTQKLEALGTLAGGIAHDFNNLLQGILGNAALLCENLKDGTEERHKSELIKTAAERSADLCVQMLDYAGVKPASHEPLNINNVIRDISVLLETSLPKDVNLVMDLSNRVPQVQGDKSQLRQVIMNLVLNGAESIIGSGEVEISTDFVFRKMEHFKYNLLDETPEDGDYLLMQVKDSGSGIDPVTLTRIFDPFFSTKNTGRGLGLAAVLGIIRGHSGAIMVNSEPGSGTEFSVYLRACGENKPEIIGIPAAVSYQSLSGRKIMVVDDDDIVRETITSILDTTGCQFIPVSGGVEAIALLENDKDIPDLMILDLTMPELSGAAVFLRLRDMGLQFPVIVVSGYSKEKQSSLFPGRTPDGFLQKPFSPDELKGMLCSLLGGS